MVEGEDEWRLKYSFNRGSIETQDSWIVPDLDSLKDCLTKFERYKVIMERMGFTVLSAYVFSPDGREIKIFSDGVGHRIIYWVLRSVLKLLYVSEDGS